MWLCEFISFEWYLETKNNYNKTKIKQENRRIFAVVGNNDKVVSYMPAKFNGHLCNYLEKLDLSTLIKFILVKISSLNELMTLGWGGYPTMELRSKKVREVVYVRDRERFFWG